MAGNYDKYGNYDFSMFEPEMTDVQLITCLENSRHIDSDKIKKLVYINIGIIVIEMIVKKNLTN